MEAMDDLFKATHDGKEGSRAQIEALRRGYISKQIQLRVDREYYAARKKNEGNQTVSDNSDTELLTEDIDELTCVINRSGGYISSIQKRWQRVERLARLGAAVEANPSGTQQTNVGPVTICCMKDESRALLNRMMEEYAKFHEIDREAAEEKPAYGFAYWLCRYSGIILALPEHTHKTSKGK